MIKHIIPLLCIVTLGITSCLGTNNTAPDKGIDSENTTSENTLTVKGDNKSDRDSPEISTNADDKSSPYGRVLTPEEEEGNRLIKRRNENQRNAQAVAVKNTTSTWRYLNSSDEFPIFSMLLLKSQLSKYIHANYVTILAPVDKAFSKYPQYKQLTLPENKDMLDEFISYHIINTSLEYKQFSEGTTWEVHAGEVLELSNQGGVLFNGAHVRSGHIDTDKGSIIGMDDVVYKPELP